MKILGFDNAKKSKRTCRNCCAIIEYTLSDTTTTKHSYHFGETDTWRHMVCPNCEYKISWID